jgi:dihydrofolate reductase
MNVPKISFVVAISENRVMGYKDRLPWKRIPEDLQRLKNLTLNKVVVMGKKTFLSMDLYYSKTGRDFPGRVNIVVTRDPSFTVERKNCRVAHSVDEALEEAKKYNDDEIFVIGGGQIFSEMFNRADKLYLTVVKGEFEGDVFFPKYIGRFTKEISREEHEYEGQRYTFLELER